VGDLIIGIQVLAKETDGFFA